MAKAPDALVTAAREVRMNRMLRPVVAVVPVLLAVAGILMLPGIC